MSKKIELTGDNGVSYKLYLDQDAEDNVDVRVMVFKDGEPVYIMPFYLLGLSTEEGKLSLHRYFNIDGDHIEVDKAGGIVDARPTINEEVA